MEVYAYIHQKTRMFSIALFFFNSLEVEIPQMPINGKRTNSGNISLKNG